jgi:O-antigen ligase
MAVAVAALGIGLGIALTTAIGPVVASAIAMVIYALVFVVAPLPGLVLWLILYPFAETRVFIPLGANMADLSTTRLAAAALCGVLLAQVAIGKRSPPRVTALDLCGLLLVAGMGLSTFSSHEPLRAAQQVLDSYLIPLLLFFAVRHYVNQRRDVELLFTAILVMASYSLLFAIYEQLTGHIVLSPGVFTLTEYTGGIRILRSLWGSNSVFGSVFGSAIPVALYRMLQSQRGPARTTYALLAGLYMLGMFLTYKRTAWIAMLVSLLIMAVLHPPFRRVLLVLVLGASLPMAVFWSRISESSLVEQRLTYNLDTLNGRTTRWQAAIDLWLQRPLAGYGFGNYDRISGYQAVQSQYFHILVSGGLIAFAPYFAFLLLTLQQSLLIYIRGPSRPAVFVSRPTLAVFLAMFSIYCVKSVSETQGTPMTLLFFILVGAVVGSQSERLVPAGAARPQNQPDATRAAATEQWTPEAAR